MLCDPKIDHFCKNPATEVILPPELLMYPTYLFLMCQETKDDLHGFRSGGF